MSTPRHQDYCKFCQGDEGVAAPLEPSAHDLAHRIWAIGYIGPVPKPTAADEAEIKLIAKMVSEWAAAVSKNLQEELARLQSEVAVRDEWLRFADAEDLKTYRELRNQAGKSPR